LIFELKRDYTIVIVTHNMQQAARVSDLTAFFYQGRIIESGPTEQLYTRPHVKQNRGLHHRPFRMRGRWRAGGVSPLIRDGVGDCMNNQGADAPRSPKSRGNGSTMAKHLQRDLDGLQRTCWPCRPGEGAVQKAIHALQERDVSLAREVIDGDGQIDNEENHIDEECLKILALHQPWPWTCG